MLGIIFIRIGNKVRVLKNVITQTGMEWVAQRIGNSSASPFQYIAVGSGLNPASVNDLSLQNEIDRVLADITIEQRTITYVATFTSGTFDFSEIGIFNSTIGGTMFARYCNGSVIDTKPEYENLEITYKVIV